MTKHEVYETKTAELVAPILTDCSVSLYDVEFVKEAGTFILRLTIEKPEGVNITDCENVSRALSDKLDEADFIDEAYTLEVSSPGLGRPLKKTKDYERNLEKEVEIHVFRAIDKVKEFAGTLKKYDDDTVTIECEGETIVFEKKNISLIREYVDWEAQ